MSRRWVVSFGVGSLVDAVRRAEGVVELVEAHVDFLPLADHDAMVDQGVDEGLVVLDALAVRVHELVFIVGEALPADALGLGCCCHRIAHSEHRLVHIRVQWAPDADRRRVFGHFLSPLRVYSRAENPSTII